MLNIGTYYMKRSQLYLYQFIAVSILLLFFYLTDFLHSFAIIFYVLWIFLLYLFVHYLFYEWKVKNSKAGKCTQIKCREDLLLLLFTQGPHLKMHFFLPNGLEEMELYQDVSRFNWLVPPMIDNWTNRRFFIRDRSGLLIASIYVSKRQPQITLLMKETVLSLQLIRKRHRKLVFIFQKDEISVEQKYGVMKIKKNDQMMCQMQKGWMPISWQRTFAPNTPILIFSDNASEIDRLICLALIQYLSHI